MNTDDVTPLCLRLVNEMRWNLIKIRSMTCAILGGLTGLTGFRWMRLYSLLSLTHNLIAVVSHHMSCLGLPSIF